MSAPSCAPACRDGAECRAEAGAGGAAAEKLCAECGGALRAGGDGAVELSLPGDEHAALLHGACRAAYEERRAPRCDQCGGGMAERMVVLSRPSGDARVHPGCVDAFRAAGAPRCAHCGDAVTDDQCAEDGATELRLPGEERAALLHAACRAAYEEQHAPRCDQCGGGMPEQMMVLPGPGGDARLHPGCVDAFRAAGAPRCADCGDAVTGVVSVLADGTELHPGCVAAHRRRAAPACAGCGGAVVDDRHTVIGGRAYHDRCAACAHCGAGFAAAEPLLELALPPPAGAAATVAALQSASLRAAAAQPGLRALRASLCRPAFLHTRCVAAHREARAPRCAYCVAPVLGQVARLWGEWGEARVHPGDCAAAFRRELGASGAPPAPRAPPSVRTRAAAAPAPVTPILDELAPAEERGAAAPAEGPQPGDEPPRVADVRIVGHAADAGGKRTVFTVTFTADGEPRAAPRYYSDFRALRARLPLRAPPAFPAKTFFRCAGRALDERRAQLDAWLRAAVAQSAEGAAGDAVRGFLGAGAALAPPATPSSVASPRSLATTA